MDQSYVLLWSQSQCCFHIEQLRDMYRANAAAFREDRRMDYVPLHIGTDDECHALADHLRPQVRQRQEVRALAREAIEKAAL